MLNVIVIKLSQVTSVGTVQTKEGSESGIRKWEEMWFKTTADDGERGDSSDVWWKTVPQTSERLQQETLVGHAPWCVKKKHNKKASSAAGWCRYCTLWMRWSSEALRLSMFLYCESNIRTRNSSLSLRSTDIASCWDFSLSSVWHLRHTCSTISP